jgi:signal transduction histidine kinase
MRILRGEPPSSIKIEPSNFEAPKYDWRLLHRWGIDESRVPAGSHVLFRSASIWETYRWQVMLICATVLMQSLLITGLLYERRQRQVAQTQSRQRMTELAHVNRQSVAGELAASISHELNQPLGAILSNAETAELMISVNPPDLNEITQILADIKRDDHRASEVLRRLRSLLKKSPFELKTIDLNDVVRDTVEFVLAVARMRGVSLSTSLASVDLPIKGDAVQLQQVIMNLMLNAADAMANMPSQQRQIEIRTERVEDKAELSVWDTGPGVPPSKLKDIFEPFYSTKEAGMGMGLSIARTIVEAHGGTISAENRMEGGAIFRIQLPIV